MISEITQLDVVKAANDPRPVPCVLYPDQPFVENICRFYFVFHVNTVAFKRQFVKNYLKYTENKMLDFE